MQYTEEKTVCIQKGLSIFLNLKDISPDCPPALDLFCLSAQVHRQEEGFVELFGKENIVFLTSDSPNVLSGKLLMQSVLHGVTWSYMHTVGVDSLS